MTGMRIDRRRLLAVIAPGVVLALWLVLGAVLGWIMLQPARKDEMIAAVGPLIESHGMLVFAWWLLLATLAAWVVARFHASHVAAPARLADATRALAQDAAAPDLPVEEAGSFAPLAAAVNGLAAERRALARDMERLVAAASRDVAQQRDQLAALMAELEQSVVVCNLSGRILLYNARARALFRRVVQPDDGGADAAGVAEPIGLGRSIHALIDPAYMEHARAEVERRLARGEAGSSARFVITTPAGHLLQVSMAPVRPAGESDMAPGKGTVDNRVVGERGLNGEIPDHDIPGQETSSEETSSQASAERDISGQETRARNAGDGQTPFKAAVGDARPGISGFVLLLDDITEEYEAHARRDRRLLELTEASRASFASMQAALDMLDYPDLDAAERERFQNVVRDEVRAMSVRLGVLATDAAQDLKTRWPLQSMPGTDLVATAIDRIAAATGARAKVEAVDATVWLSVDSFTLMSALIFLARRLEEERPGLELALRLSPAGWRAHLDLIWNANDLPVEKLVAWQSAPMAAPGGEAATPLCVRDVAERHGGEVWLEHEPASGRSFFRFLLPMPLGEVVDLLSPADSRPEYYDFDLLSARAGSHDLEELDLLDISYTVFDTETTGLDPRGGDEILQIGATRIVNGKLLRGECFDQLVDPQRSIPEAGIAVHGVTPQMVRGQPTLAQVLPRFRAFVSDTVLVGHNVAFDMRFLKLKEEATGIRFDQPVLDTLLLASIVWPSEDNHGLDALARRLGVSAANRHRALGDALATGEVFLRLLPLLRQRGIHTLRQAREAAAESYYARLRY